jgi:surface polysaccharide O-acyltransferase-like enzyme
MNRERALKVVLVLVGLLFTAAVYPVAMDLWHGNVSDSGDTMMMSLYCTLGVFLLLAVRNPSAHRSLIAFAAWSSFAHAAVMSALALEHKFANERAGFLGGSGVLVVIGIVLLVLAPARPSREPASAPAV